MSKTSQVEEIPAKIVKENLNVLTTSLVKDINICIVKWEFPDKLKMADITPAFKLPISKNTTDIVKSLWKMSLQTNRTSYGEYTP